MCGITGVWAFDKKGEEFLPLLESSTASLSHRGPDYQGVWSNDHLGLGHRRLSIIDTSEHGHQPMQVMDGRYSIVFNGEIFNFSSLKKELLAKDIQFVSDSDTEVLLYLYATEGKSCLNKLNGFFAFAIYDALENTLFLARDRFGIKPLLYFQDDSKFLFASEMQAILSYGIDRKINKEALSNYLQLNYTPARLTMVEGVAKLLPGHCIEIKDGHVDVSQYYDLPRYKPVENPLNYEAAMSRLVEVLDESVQRRMIADVPLGSFLSGGIDSSVVTALASRHTNNLSTFSIGFEGNKFFDETHYAELVSKKFNTNHAAFRLSNDDIFSKLEDFVEHIDEPFADSSALPVYILSQKTREHVTVALSGDGADEIFSGYNKHDAWWKMDNQPLFTSFVKLASHFMRPLPKSRSGKFSNIARQFIRYADAAQLSPADRYWFLASLATPQQADNLLQDGIYPSSFRSEAMSDLNDFQDMNDMLRMDTQFVLPNDMLKKVDMMSMAASLEVRVPFLDHNVLEFVFSLPEEFKINGNMRKRILQDAFRDVLPSELYQRPKKGFEMPLLDWLRTSLKPDLDEYVFNRERVEAVALFSWKEISKLEKQLMSINPEDCHARIWAIYVFMKWYVKYF